MSQLTIGKLAKAAGVGIETVRFYEKKGLIKTPVARNGAFRVYSNENIDHIRFIKRVQDLGFTLREIKELLALDQNSRSSCAVVASKTNNKIREIQNKIADLRKVEESLKNLLCACDVSPQAKACCRITNCFDGTCCEKESV